MKSNITSLVCAALLCGSVAVQAQTPTPSPERKPPTPEQRQKFHTDMKAAHENCKSVSDKRACMTQNFCAKQADPAKCQASANERQAERAKRVDQRQEIAEACTGKRGDTLKSCYKEQAEKRGIKPGHRGHRGMHGQDGMHGHHQKG